MSRRPRKPRRPQILWIDWTDQAAQLFRLVPPEWGWTPPARIKVVRGLRHSTFSARFTTPEGATNTARVRVRRGADGEWNATAEELEISLGRMTKAQLLAAAREADEC